MTSHLNRAQLLFEQGRYDLAAEELGRQMAQDADDPFARCLLALCLSKLKRRDEAVREAQAATHLAPDLAYAYYVLGSVLDDVPRLKDAEAAAREAVRLDPEDADYYALLASVRFQQQHWADALRYADAGLALDAGNIPCANLRGMALVRLNRKEDAAATIQGTLARDPENAAAHANQGWALLHRSRPQEALEHFQEALRLKPDMEWARQGVLEALRARNPVYRVILNYFLWMARLGQKARYGVLIGLYILPRLLNAYAAGHPALVPAAEVFFGLYLLFAFLTWTARPLFNVLLRVDKIGRYALSRRQMIASNWVGSSFLLLLLTVSCALLLRQKDAVYGFGTGYAFLTVFTAAAFSGSTVGIRRLLGSLTALLGACAVALTVYAAFSYTLWLGALAAALVTALLAFNVHAQLASRQRLSVGE